MIPTLLLLLLFVVPVHAAAQSHDSVPHLLESIDEERMFRDVQELSSPYFEGRQAGTQGGRRSALYVAKRFEHLGLHPAGTEGLVAQSQNWFQLGPITVSQFPTLPTLELTPLPSRTNEESLHPQLGLDYLPVLDSPALKTMAQIIFVGYGISDPARGFDEYEGVNVRNRIVMFLRGQPTQYPQRVTHVDKERVARKKGAVAFITLTGPLLSPYEARRGMGHQPLAFYSNAGEERSLPGVWIHTTLGERLFQRQGLSLPEIQKTLNETLHIQSQALGFLGHFQWESIQGPGQMINVLGVIPGEDPRHRDEIVVIGAHRDHFGTQAGVLFAGADDNASGTAVLLEVARLMLKAQPLPRRTILFVSFSGEEQGLRGSRLYTRTTNYALQQTVAMINIDHVGVGNGKLTVGVAKLPKIVAQKAADLAGLTKQIKLYGYFPGGDHVPFAEVGIPTVAVVSHGTHPSFHQESDTVEKIQPEILATAARFVLSLSRLLANPL